MKPVIIVDGERIDPKEFKYSHKMDALLPYIIVGDQKLEVSFTIFEFNKSFGLTKATIETVTECSHKFMGALRPTQNGYKTDQFCLKCHQWKTEIGVFPSVLARHSNQGHGT